MCHLDLAANTAKANPHISDLTIKFRTSDGRELATKAYGPVATKILARWHQTNIGSNTGNFVQTNADNFAMFALAKYVQKELGNFYPHLPIVTQVPLRAPRQPWQDSISAYIAEFVAEGDEFYLNTTDSILTLENDWDLEFDGEETAGCSDDPNSGSYPPISIDGFAPASAYPDDYNSQVSSWISALATASSAASPATTTASSSATLSPPSAYTTGICSFHLKETQTCEPVTKNLFAIINLKDGAGKDIGDTPVASGSVGVGINDGAGYVFSSDLPYPLVITGEHEYDYIQFTYGNLSWQSRKPNGGGRCNVGGWDPRDGPVCAAKRPVFAINNMDCFFPC